MFVYVPLRARNRKKSNLNFLCIKKQPIFFLMKIMEWGVAGRFQWSAMKISESTCATALL